jgi:hypothetical protein
MRTYSHRTCNCGKEVSAAGLAWYNHMMGHVRRGEATRNEYSTSLKAATGLRETFFFTWIKGVKCQPNKSR